MILIAACCAINARYKISEQLLNVDEVVAGRLKIRKYGTSKNLDKKIEIWCKLGK